MAASGDLVAKVLDTLGHDLRGPIFTARGYVQLLQARVQEPRLKEMADAAIASLDDAARLVEGVLAWARTEPHRIVMEDADLGELAAQAVEHLAGTGARIEVGPLPTVHGDRRALRYALQHLMDNGLRYGGQGSVQVEGGRGTDGSWWVEVHDRGPGLPAEGQDQLWLPFWEAKGRAKGVGLALAAKAARIHGGKMIVRPRKGGGTTMRLEGRDG